jgi:hypothetical protein
VFLNIAAKIQNAKVLVILISRESYLIFNPKQKRSKMIHSLTGEELFFKTDILQCILEKLKTRSYYLSWWLRLDLNNKYPTAKINYELKKAVKEGLLVAVSHRHGIEYSLPSIIDNKK